MHDRISSLYDNLNTYVLGCENASTLLITGLLANGHVLIQGAPGVGKTSLAKTMAASLQCEFKRIQFTPDLLPSDVVGYTIYDQDSNSFVFHNGPVFGNVILADEINRAGPRTQSALLEAMNERQVSVDGSTYSLERPFFVVATENHLTTAGTFALPDSQLDRFLLSFKMDAPGPDSRMEILKFHAGSEAQETVRPTLTRNELANMQLEVMNSYVSGNIQRYIVDISERLKKHKDIDFGPSPRAEIALMNAARAYAYVRDRNAVHPDDVKTMAPYVLRHRLSLRHTRGHDSDHVERLIDEILTATPVPMDES